MKRARQCAGRRGEERVSVRHCGCQCGCVCSPADCVIMLLKHWLDYQGPCLLQTAVALKLHDTACLTLMEDVA